MRKRNEHYVVHLQGEPRKYYLKRTSRTRINIRISHEGEIVVSAPGHVSISRIEEALLKRESWIMENIKKQHHLRSNEWNPLSILGEAYTVTHTGNPSGRIRINHTRKTITAPDDPARVPQVRSSVIRALKRESKRLLHGRINDISDAIGIYCDGISVRDQRTRWGSSSDRGTINLNWRILMAPPRVIDYLIIHELVHQVHHNHSKQFWNTVGTFMKDYREADAWLKKNSFLLNLFR